MNLKIKISLRPLPMTPHLTRLSCSRLRLITHTSTPHTYIGAASHRRADTRDPPFPTSSFCSRPPPLFFRICAASEKIHPARSHPSPVLFVIQTAWGLLL